jgi:hypothetical protein
LPACVTSCLHMQFYGTLCKKSFHRISNFEFDIFEHKKTPAFPASAHHRPSILLFYLCIFYGLYFCSIYQSITSKNSSMLLVLWPSIS